MAKFVSKINEFIAFDKIVAWVFAYFGSAAPDVANEKPEPNRSMNIMLVNWVARFVLSTNVLSIVNNFGPMPPKFIYCEERPGVPTAKTKGKLAKFS